MSNRFSEVTKRIQKKLPYWMKKMRNDQHSVGAQFLNIFGLQIEDVEFVLNYAYEQTKIKTADTNQVAWVYKFFVPAIINLSTNVTISSDNFTLTKSETIEEFLMSTDSDPVHGEIKFDNPYLIDYEKHLIYVRKPYDADEQYKDGRIKITLTENEEVIYDEIRPLTIHPIWNFFDEFGLLLATPRLREESNNDYMLRILDVFRHPSGASPKNLAYGIARELSLRAHYTWLDGAQDYVITDNMVMVNTIEVDEIEFPMTKIFKNKEGRLVLKGDSDFFEISRKLTYIHGIEMHALHNKNDKILQSQINEPGKPFLNYIKEVIDTKAPILWGSFIWDESLWDIFDENIGSTGSRLDAFLYSRTGGRQ